MCVPLMIGTPPCRLKDIDVFKSVLENEHFKANPAETMLNHLTLLVQRQYQNQGGEQGSSCK